MLQAAGLEEVTNPREDLTRAVTELFEALARRRPLVLIFEDVHWAEPPLLDLVEHLLSRIRDAPLMLLCLARDDADRAAAAVAGRDAGVQHARARALSAPATRALVRSLLPAAEAGEQVDERLAERAEGNPLFAEQLSRCSRGRGTSSLPPTIQALLAARLDRLRPRSGPRSEPPRWWAVSSGATRWALLPDQEEQGVRELLDALAAKRLVVTEESTLESEEGYSFTHVLVRDAAYEALTKQDRADLHERVADWLERRHPERMIELEAIVGHHLEDAYRHHADLGPIGPAGTRSHSARRGAWRRRDHAPRERARTPRRPGCCSAPPTCCRRTRASASRCCR